ncbi:right-handed parallel beta-helix repeat-containing protein [Methanobrevibacter smithii]|uniref:right-handed parallel beta-helix repeat-containing protein n=1 Tax=Methanobrevibacter smithii TaxID=2173 RepID=UPI0037DC2DB2
MNKKGLILSIFISLIVILSSGSVFAEDISNANSDDSASSPIANDAVYGEITTSSNYTVHTGSNSSTIQNIINSMHDGDVLNFEKGEYKDICIYIDKNITVNGNGAQLIGYQTPGINNTNIIPDIVKNTTKTGGYGISNFATVYILKTSNVKLNGLTMVSLNSTTYSNAVLYAYQSKNLEIINNTIIGSSWGIYLQTCVNTTINQNTIKNQATTGILNFGSAKSIIKNNKITNAVNHGIDIRHGTGPNVTVFNNTIIGSKEGIYLMHSGGHTVYNNTIINCTISSITCYGSSNIYIYNNTMFKSRMGVLLGSGFSNITIGENNYKLANLPYPPTFVYYVGIADSAYQSPQSVSGTYSDSSTYSPEYTNKIDIEAPKDIVIDYNGILKPTGTTYTVPVGTASEDIQKMIDSMKDGDTLSFEKNGIYENICIYVDKNIKILGNNATLIGYETKGVNNSNIPLKVWKKTNEGGYGCVYFSVLYLFNTDNAVVSDLNIVGKAPGYNPNTVGTTTDEYKTTSIYSESNKNITITNCDVKGSSWGIFLQYNKNAVIANNNIHDQYTTGLINFGSANSIIANNTVTNAVNHGIDIRHGTGPNVTVFNNTLIGSKEGIYLMHSSGHKVYNNTIIKCTLSSITAYGSGNEAIFNNTLSGSRIGIIVGGGYYNVTIGSNNYNLDRLPFPPSFPYYIVQADNKYQTPDKAQGTYYDSAKEPKAVIIVDDIIMYYKNGTKLHITLKDNKGYNLADTPITVTINGVSYKKTTDKNGVVEMNINLRPGVYTATVAYAGNKTIGANSVDAKITVLSTINGNNITKMYQNGTHFSATFVNGQGKVLANTKVTFNINGVFYTRQTNAYGTANLNIMLRPGHYILTAYNPVTGDEQGFSIDVKSLIETSDLTKYYLNASRFQATIYNKDGSLAVNKNVTFNINGVFYIRTTDSNGVVSLAINLRPGDYIITTIFDGLDIGNKVTVLPTLVTKDLNMKYMDGSNFTAQTLDGKGTPLTNQTVSFNVNGVIYHRITNEDGIASLRIRLISGEYIITSYWNNFQTGNTIKIA